MININKFTKYSLIFSLYFLFSINTTFGVQDDDFFSNNDSEYDCKSIGGTCIDYNKYNCGGTTKTGLCPGATNIKCCVGKKSLKTSTSNKVKVSSGTTVNNSSNGDKDIKQKIIKPLVVNSSEKMCFIAISEPSLIDLPECKSVKGVYGEGCDAGLRSKRIGIGTDNKEYIIKWYVSGVGTGSVKYYFGIDTTNLTQLTSNIKGIPSNGSINGFQDVKYKLNFNGKPKLDYSFKADINGKTVSCSGTVLNAKKVEGCGSEFFNNVNWNSDDLNLEKMLDSCEPGSGVITSDKDSTSGGSKDYTLAGGAKERTVKTVNQVISLAFLGTIATTSLAGVNLVTSLGKDDKLKKAKNMLTYSLIGLTTTASAFPLSNAIINTIFKIGN